MTRTQVLLEPTQYRWLVEQARRQHKSLSEVLRGLIEARQADSRRDRKADPLFRLIGTGKDRARDVAEHHDRYLYGSASSEAR